MTAVALILGLGAYACILLACGRDNAVTRPPNPFAAWIAAIRRFTDALKRLSEAAATMKERL